jgi:hypothetical protein
MALILEGKPTFRELLNFLTEIKTGQSALENEPVSPETAQYPAPGTFLSR